jgi:terminase large subunit-like protein
MEFDLTVPQSRVFADQSRFRVLVAGRRFGKTFLSVLELCRAVWGKPDSLAWYVAPTYKQAKKITWRKLKQAVMPYVTRKPNETDLSVEIQGGGMIALCGAEEYDSLRGPGLDFVVFDEYADTDPLAWTEVIRPMLSDREGGALFIGTPKGFNHFYEMYAGASRSPGWSSFLFTTLDGGQVKPEEIEAARRDLNEKSFRQEYLASFENFEGRAYYAFDRNVHVKKTVYDRRLPICWSLDFNITPMCSVICQIRDKSDFSPITGHRRDCEIHVLDEIRLINSNTPEACQAFAERVEPYMQGQPLIVSVYGDATGKGKQHAVGGGGANSDWAVVRDFFANHRGQFKPSYKYRASNPLQRDRVAAMNGALRNGDGYSRMTVDPKCEHLVKDLEGVAWKQGVWRLDEDTDPMLTHLSDALGYLVMDEMGYQQSGGPRPTFIA